MSNEELAQRIQDGERGLISQLWEQVAQFIRLQAYKRYVLTGGMGGVEVEDLAQSGYFALLAALDTYDRSTGYKFLTYLSVALKNAFREATGYHPTRSVKHDLIDKAASLDAPLSGDDEEFTLGDTLADPMNDYDALEHKIWLDQLQETMSRALDTLPAEWRDVLHRYYWQGQTEEQIGRETKTSRQEAQKRKRDALLHLYRHKHRLELEQFVDARTPYYLHVALPYFTATHTSAVELAVFKREALEKNYTANGE